MFALGRRKVRARPALRRAGRACAVSVHGRSHSFWRRTEQGLDGELTAVFACEMAQCFGSTVDFIFGDDAVVIPVEHGDDRWEVRPFVTPTLVLAVASGWWSGRASLRLLRERESCGQGERDCDDGCVVFHGLVLVWLLAVGAVCRGSGGKNGTYSVCGGVSLAKGDNLPAFKGVCAFFGKIVKEL